MVDVARPQWQCVVAERQLFTRFAMTPLERLNRALIIRKALEDLMTTKESTKYLDGFNDYWEDYIRDLTKDYQETLAVNLPPFLS